MFIGRAHSGAFAAGKDNGGEVSMIGGLGHGPGDCKSARNRGQAGFLAQNS
jgi:hypothetical protein